MANIWTLLSQQQVYLIMPVCPPLAPPVYLMTASDVSQYCRPLPRRYCRRIHTVHCLMTIVAAADRHTLYSQLRDHYNTVCVPGTRPVPPLDEWQGVGFFCTHIFCRYSRPVIEWLHAYLGVIWSM